MPVTVESSVSGPFIPNGVATAFAFNFKADSATEVFALDADGDAISTALYSVALNLGEGGTVTFSVAPTLAEYAAIFIVSVPAMTQESDFGNAGPSFNPASVTRAFDRAAIRDLYLKGQLDRSFKVPAGEIAPSVASLSGLNEQVLVMLDGQIVPRPFSSFPTGPAGPTGPALNTYTDLATFKAQPVTNKSAVFNDALYTHVAVLPSGAVVDDDLFVASDISGFWISSKTINSGYFSTALGSAVIRQSTSGGGWSFLADAGHVAGNFSGTITVASGNIVIPYGYTAPKVGQLTITPDEAYAGLGIVPGASVGNATATVSLYMPIHIFGNLTSVATGVAATTGLAANTYFTGDALGLKTASDVVITHPSCGSAANVPNSALHFTSADVVAWDNRVTSYTATSVTVSTFVDFLFTVSYNGTSWDIASPMNVAPTFVSFGAGGALTIAFNQTLPITMLYPQISHPYHATIKDAKQFGGLNTTQLAIVFVDSAGAIITAPAVGMTATVSFPVKVKAATPAGRITITRPNVKVDANKVFSGSGNFWINSLHPKVI